MIDSPVWWAQAKRSLDLATAIWTRAEALQARRRKQNLRDLLHEAMYLGQPLGGASESFTLASMAVQRSAPANINVIRTKAQAIASRMAKHRAFPVISAEDAGWTEKRFAKRNSSVLRSKLGQTVIERDRTLRVRDSIVRGTGVAKSVRTENGDVTIERIPRSELLVSSREAQYGCPRSIFQVRSYPLEVMQARYPDEKRFLEAEATRAKMFDAGWYLWGDDWADDTKQNTVIEAWHLPSSPTAKDGRHVRTIRGRVLSDEKWDRPRFPFAYLHWDAPFRGLFGSGLVEDLAGPQAKINDVARDIQEALYYGAQLTVFSPRGSKINKEHLRARHPKVVEYDGQLPTYLAPLPVSQQLFQFLDWLLNWCDDASGLSRDFQSGKTQLGAGASGRALDTLDDIQSDRFAMFQLHDSLHMVDIGMLVVDEARAIYNELPKSEMAPWIAEHRWHKMDIDEGLYHLKLEPINFLPDTRAGKLSAVTELGQAGLIQDPTDTLDLLDEPDLQRMNRKLLGPRKSIARVMSELAETDVPLYTLAPDAFFPLEAGIAEARAELNDAWANRAPDAVLERFRKWIEMAETEKDRAATAGVAPGMPAPMPMAPDAAALPAGGLPPPDAGLLPPEAMAPPMGAPLPGV